MKIHLEFHSYLNNYEYFAMATVAFCFDENFIVFCFFLTKYDNWMFLTRKLHESMLQLETRKNRVKRTSARCWANLGISS